MGVASSGLGVIARKPWVPTELLFEVHKRLGPAKGGALDARTDGDPVLLQSSDDLTQGQLIRLRGSVLKTDTENLIRNVFAEAAIGFKLRLIKELIRRGFMGEGLVVGRIVLDVRGFLPRQ